MLISETQNNIFSFIWLDSNVSGFCLVTHHSFHFSYICCNFKCLILHFLFFSANLPFCFKLGTTYKVLLCYIFSQLATLTAYSLPQLEPSANLPLALCFKVVNSNDGVLLSYNFFIVGHTDGIFTTSCMCMTAICV